MIHVFISYGGNDRPFAEKLATTIKKNFKDIIETRIIESEDDFDANTWKQKVLSDLENTSIFIIIISENSIHRQWPNQELGYAFALKKHAKIELKIIPVVEVEGWEGNRAKYVELKGFITEDMDKVHYDPKRPDDCISEVISKIEAIDLDGMERELNPHLKDFSKEDLRILKHLMIEIYEECPTSPLYIEEILLSELLNIKPQNLKDTLYTFVEKGIFDIINRNYYQLTLKGYWIYAPIFLKIKPQQDVDMIYNLFSSQELHYSSISGLDIKKSTNLNTLRINYSVEILENSGYVELLIVNGTAPYRFGGVKLTPKGRHELQKDKTTK